jgi:hypothetical protein
MSRDCFSPLCPELGGSPAVTVDPAGNPHATYVAADGTFVHIAHDGASWSTETLSVAPTGPHAFASDAAGGLHLVLADGGTLIHGYRCP